MQIVIKNKPKKERDFIYMEDNVKVILDENVVKKSYAYAKKRFEKDSSYYEKRRDANPEKIFDQLFYSIACEFAAAKVLGIDESHVDTEIYDIYNKSWKEDLDDQFPVKSTSFNQIDYIRKGTNGESNESWTFQYSNKDGWGGKDEKIFDVPSEIQSKKCVVFATIENEKIIDGTCVFIRGMVTLKNLYQYNLLKDPIAPKYKGSKKNVYDGDLKKLQMSELK